MNGCMTVVTDLDRFAHLLARKILTEPLIGVARSRNQVVFVGTAFGDTSTKRAHTVPCNHALGNSDRLSHRLELSHRLDAVIVAHEMPADQMALLCPVGHRYQTRLYANRASPCRECRRGHLPTECQIFRQKRSPKSVPGNRTGQISGDDAFCRRTLIRLDHNGLRDFAGSAIRRELHRQQMQHFG